MSDIFLLAIFRRFSIEIVSICELKIFAIFRCSIFSCFVSWNGNKKLFQTWYETLISVAIMWRTDGEWESQWNMFGINKNGSFARIILTQVRTEYFKFDHSLFVAATKKAVRMHCIPQWTNRWTKWDARKKKPRTIQPHFLIFAKNFIYDIIFHNHHRKLCAKQPNHTHIRKWIIQQTIHMRQMLKINVLLDAFSWLLVFFLLSKQCRNVIMFMSRYFVVVKFLQFQTAWNGTKGIFIGFMLNW